jgi:YtxH-like protein
MSIDSQSYRDYSFAVGLVAGAVVGAGVMMLFAPTTGADLRQRIGNAIDDAAERGRSVVGQGGSEAAVNTPEGPEPVAAAARMRAVSREL